MPPAQMKTTISPLLLDQIDMRVRTIESVSDAVIRNNWLHCGSTSAITFASC